MSLSNLKAQESMWKEEQEDFKRAGVGITPKKKHLPDTVNLMHI